MKIVAIIDKFGTFNDIHKGGYHDYDHGDHSDASGGGHCDGDAGDDVGDEDTLMIGMRSRARTAARPMTIIILIVTLSFYPLKPRLPRVLVFVACQPLERSSRWTVVEASWGKAGPCCCHATNFALPLIPALVLTNFVTIFSTCTVCTSTCTTLKKGLKLPPNNATNHGFWS